MRLRFPQGAYGWDNLSKFLMVVSIPFWMSLYTLVIGIFLAGYGVGRALSRNVQKRRLEDIAFERWARKMLYHFYAFKQKNPFRRIRNWRKGIVPSWKDRKSYLVVRCPQCGQKLRLPTNKGTLMVTCSKCKHRFKKKT